MPRRVRFILFCDQIRQEANAKNIYIGTYGHAMLVYGSFPAVLPSFAVAVAIDPPTTKMMEETVEVTINVPGLDQPQQILHKVKRKHPRDSASLHLNFVPFLIPKPGELQVTVSLQDGEQATCSLEIAEREAYLSQSPK